MPSQMTSDAVIMILRRSRTLLPGPSYLLCVPFPAAKRRGALRQVSASHRIGLRSRVHVTVCG